MLRGIHKFALHQPHDAPTLSSSPLLLRQTHRLYLPMNTEFRPQGVYIYIYISQGIYIKIYIYLFINIYIFLKVSGISKNSAISNFGIGWK